MWALLLDLSDIVHALPNSHSLCPVGESYPRLRAADPGLRLVRDDLHFSFRPIFSSLCLPLCLVKFKSLPGAFQWFHCQPFMVDKELTWVDGFEPPAELEWKWPALEFLPESQGLKLRGYMWACWENLNWMRLRGPLKSLFKLFFKTEIRPYIL